MSGPLDIPPRVLLSGPEGIGKSTFGSKAPKPLFICSEDGLTGLSHVKRITPKTLDELHQLLDAVLSPSFSGYESLVFDTADWLERFLAASICARDGKANIEEYGYGKGYTLLENELTKILSKLDEIRAKKKMWIVILSHVEIKAFNDPRGDTWDRFQMKGNKKFTGLLREWPDACLFAVFKVFKTEDKKKGTEKTIAGERVIHTNWSPAWDAKNRLNLPEELPLDWDEFQKAVEENSVLHLVKKARALFATAKGMPDADKPKYEVWLKKAELALPEKIKAVIEKLEQLQDAKQ
jgi:hypothetical protein